MKFFRNIFRVWSNELRLIFRDGGVLIFFFILPLAYPVVYTLIYNPEVLRDIPVAVVDNSRTAASRDLTRMLDATPAAEVIGIASDIAEAKRWMAEKKCYAVMEIPQDYARKTGRAEQVRIPVYCDMSLLLRYRTLGFALTDIQLEKGSQIRTELISALGASTLPQANSSVENQAIVLGDQEQGFASFVIPGIIVLILQQSMILGITMLIGNSEERKRRNGGLYDPMQVREASPLQGIIGKIAAYILLYIPSTLYILHYLPEIFSLPHVGSPADYLAFILPMLLASAAFGILVGEIFVKEREMSFIVVVFTSVVFLFLSGLTWPRYAMGDFWLAVGNAIPAVQGVEGFIRINSNNATLAENSTPYLIMWGLFAAYLLLAIIVISFKNRNQSRSSSARL